MSSMNPTPPFSMDPTTSALLTDLYQITMLQAYHDQGMAETAVFDLYVRKLPENRNFLVAAGLEQALEYLETLTFTQEEGEWLLGTGMFKPGFVDYLREFKFEGEVYALPEGTVFFPDEPVMRVTAPLAQAQLVESRLINIINFQTMVASKAARMALVKGGKGLTDFGYRRAHGAEAGVMASRAAYLAGFDGTATVYAGAQFGIPVSGTMAHAFITGHENEEIAFENFARSFPEHTVLLIDTYDTVEAARKIVKNSPQWKEQGLSVKAVRIDSGDLGELSKQVREVLDEGNLQNINIIVSGDVDEYQIEELLAQSAPIDSFGVGTRLVTSSDTPYLSAVYKLQEYGGIPKRKRSANKSTWPGRKQVYRKVGPDGRMAGDIITLENDPQDGEPLLQPVMKGGKRIGPSPSLPEVRERAKGELDRLPDALRTLKDAPDYPVEYAPALKRLAEQADEYSRQ